jgi:hypothetical protein
MLQFVYGFLEAPVRLPGALHGLISALFYIYKQTIFCSLQDYI